MTTLFSRIINGEIPGRFVYRDEQAVAFLSIGPLAYGHTLVVPVQEVDKWTDASPELMSHLTGVAQKIGQVQIEVFGSQRAGLVIAGYEVDHLHLHVWPSNSLADFDFGSVIESPDDALMEDAAEKIRAGLRAAGEEEHVPAS